jgi:Domain of unknown function (DUF4440)
MGMSEMFKQLTVDLCQAECDRDEAKLRSLLDSNLRFRRADGGVITLEEFLALVGTPGYRNDTLTATVESSTVLGDQAIVSVIVQFSGLRAGRPRSGVFRNLRLYERIGDEWRVVFWFNKRIGDI